MRLTRRDLLLGIGASSAAMLAPFAYLQACAAELPPSPPVARSKPHDYTEILQIATVALSDRHGLTRVTWSGWRGEENCLGYVATPNLCICTPAPELRPILRGGFVLHTSPETFIEVIYQQRGVIYRAAQGGVDAGVLIVGPAGGGGRPD